MVYSLNYGAGVAELLGSGGITAYCFFRSEVFFVDCFRLKCSLRSLMEVSFPLSDDLNIVIYFIQRRVTFPLVGHFS